jgi:hypothetical protein
VRQAQPPPASAIGAPAYLTPEQVGDLLQLSAKTINRWADEDPTMPVLRVCVDGDKGKRSGKGRTRLRFPKGRLEAWLRSCEQGLGKPRRSKKLLPSAPAVSRESAQVLDLADGHSRGVGEAKAVGEPWAKPWATKPSRSRA